MNELAPNPSEEECFPSFRGNCFSGDRWPPPAGNLAICTLAAIFIYAVAGAVEAKRSRRLHMVCGTNAMASPDAPHPPHSPRASRRSSDASEREKRVSPKSLSQGPASRAPALRFEASPPTASPPQAPHTKLCLVDFRSGETVCSHPDVKGLLDEGWYIESAAPRITPDGTKLLVVLTRFPSGRASSIGR